MIKFILVGLIIELYLCTFGKLIVFLSKLLIRAPLLITIYEQLLTINNNCNTNLL